MTEDDLLMELGPGAPASDELFVRGVMARIEARSPAPAWPAAWPRALWVAAAAALATLAAPHLAGTFVPWALAMGAGVGAWALAEATA